MIAFRHVDVFAERPMTGNGVVVFFEAGEIGAETMQAVTREMRQFESVFLARSEDGTTYDARIFSTAGELEFAGHPILGAAAALHDREGTADPRHWRIRIAGRPVAVATRRRRPGRFSATMDQGAPTFMPPLGERPLITILAALGLEPSDAAAALPAQVVSTGLRYLIVPLRRGLDRARIATDTFERLLAANGAQFVYVLDVLAREGRHWENDGSIEDVATGSAAGPAGAYLARHGVVDPGDEIVLHQGRFVGRPSVLRVRVHGAREAIERVEVAGPVATVASGRLDVLEALSC